MKDNIYSKIYKKFRFAITGLALVLAAGTVGYRFLGGFRYSFVDCFYMTFITITTIGFGEIIDMSNNPAMRMFTIVIAVSGISLATYAFTGLTAFVVEGELSETFRRKKMETIIRKFKNHYIICGIGGVGLNIAREMQVTKRQYVIIDTDRHNIDKFLETFRDVVFIEGDATDNDMLSAAGITEASGLFAVTGDDNQNLVLSLTAKQLHPAIRVVARCHDAKNIEKMKKAGADAVVSPSSIGGLRMASEMVRATVVSFLDTMLRDREKNLRIEEIEVIEAFAGKPVSELNIGSCPSVLLLAVKSADIWVYNPPCDHVMKHGDILIVMTTPEDREKLGDILFGGKSERT